MAYLYNASVATNEKNDLNETNNIENNIKILQNKEKSLIFYKSAKVTIDLWLNKYNNHTNNNENNENNENNNENNELMNENEIKDRIEVSEELKESIDSLNIEINVRNIIYFIYFIDFCMIFV